MAIDLSTPEGRSNYLNDKLSDLINGVDSTYGNLIFDELKINEKKRQSILLKLKKQKSPDEETQEEKEKKDWEEKLLNLYGKNNASTPAEEDSNSNKGEEK